MVSLILHLFINFQLNFYFDFVIFFLMNCHYLSFISVVPFNFILETRLNEIILVNINLMFYRKLY